MNTKPILKTRLLGNEELFSSVRGGVLTNHRLLNPVGKEVSEHGSTSACLRCISHIVLVETVFFQVYWFAVNTVLQKYEPSYIFMWLENKD